MFGFYFKNIKNEKSYIFIKFIKVLKEKKRGV